MYCIHSSENANPSKMNRADELLFVSRWESEFVANCHMLINRGIQVHNKTIKTEVVLTLKQDQSKITEGQRARLSLYFSLTLLINNERRTDLILHSESSATVVSGDGVMAG